MTTTNQVVAASSIPSQEKAPDKVAKPQNYKGFVAGVFSGIAKLSSKLHSTRYDSLDANITQVIQLKPCIKHLPGYPISHIGFSTLYARQFLKVPGISFNMLQKIMTGPIGQKFLRDIKRAGRPIFLWTINDEEAMKWSIRKQVDGVITDDPKKYLDVCKKYKGEKPRMKWKQLGLTIVYQTLAVPMSLILRLKFGFRVDEKEISKLLMAASRQ